ncbi:hypothetical protein QFZ79_000141 [Arthrobacter sp. V4I6]|uniref:hypothetical protein n=1 Tax=unclassified Arthrobacter TaxID=235627 RepID=UPI00278906BB|nr:MULTISPECIES: hypothetical protein [unclassified Arthrobacter]MDQ0822404.1 hypothetical protein [Arthrobacter sp. V1I7]MDQ0852030.1 hypothetical protein [Arthrobacter sp. V4I6]
MTPEQKKPASGERTHHTALEPVSESIIEFTVPRQAALAMESVANTALRLVGGRLVTVSMWRPARQDLVRVYSNMPRIYRPGGVSTVLGAEWTRRCVGQLESFLAEDEHAINSDAFEHQDTLGALQLGAAVNAVVAKDGAFLGCLNLLGSRGSYTEQSVRDADTLTVQLAEVLAQLGSSTTG